MAKKQRFEQFGVRYPDGRVEWEGDSLHRIHSEADRAELVRTRNAKLAEVGVVNDPGLVFLRRFRVISHTDAEVVSG